MDVFSCAFGGKHFLYVADNYGNAPFNSPFQTEAAAGNVICCGLLHLQDAKQLTGSHAPPGLLPTKPGCSGSARARPLLSIAGSPIGQSLLWSSRLPGQDLLRSCTKPSSSSYPTLPPSLSPLPGVGPASQSKPLPPPALSLLYSSEVLPPKEPPAHLVSS